MGRYRLSRTVTFSHLRQEWLDRACADRSVRYDIVCDPVCARWHLDASGSVAQTVPPSPQEIRAAGGRLLAVDLNADHLVAYVYVSAPARLRPPPAVRPPRTAHP